MTLLPNYQAGSRARIYLPLAEMAMLTELLMPLPIVTETGRELENGTLAGTATLI